MGTVPISRLTLLLSEENRGSLGSSFRRPEGDEHSLEEMGRKWGLSPFPIHIQIARPIFSRRALLSQSLTSEKRSICQLNSNHIVNRTVTQLDAIEPQFVERYSVTGYSVTG